MDDEKLLSLGGGISIYTSKNHTFGHDAVLLANFAKFKSGAKICDFGTGCGIITLLFCRDKIYTQKKIKIDAVEIQEEAAELTKKSVKFNNLNDIINIISDDFLSCDLKKEYYDLIVCNPPYKKSGTGKISVSDSKKTARHENITNLESIIRRAFMLLKNGGSFCVCLRPERLAELLCLMHDNRIEPKRLRFVQQKNKNAAWLLLCEGKKNANPGLIIEPTLVLETVDGFLTDELKNIYGEF